MSVGECDSFARQSIEMRRGDFARGIEAPHIAIAEVIAQDDDDIRRSGERVRGGTQQRGDSDEQSSGVVHGFTLGTPQRVIVLTLVAHETQTGLQSTWGLIP